MNNSDGKYDNLRVKNIKLIKIIIDNVTVILLFELSDFKKRNCGYITLRNKISIDRNTGNAK